MSTKKLDPILDEDRIRSEARCIANADLNRLKNEDGTFKPLSEWPNDMRHAVKAVKTGQRGEVIDVELHDQEEVNRLLASLPPGPSEH